MQEWYIYFQTKYNAGERYLIINDFSSVFFLPVFFFLETEAAPTSPGIYLWQPIAHRFYYVIVKAADWSTKQVIKICYGANLEFCNPSLTKFRSRCSETEENLRKLFALFDISKRFGYW